MTGKGSIKSEMIEAQTQLEYRNVKKKQYRLCVEFGTSQIRGIDCVHVRNFVLLNKMVIFRNELGRKRLYFHL